MNFHIVSRSRHRAATPLSPSRSTLTVTWRSSRTSARGRSVASSGKAWLFPGTHARPLKLRPPELAAGPSVVRYPTQPNG